MIKPLPRQLVRCLVLLSLVIGLIVFYAGAYKPVLLVLETKSLETGKGQVIVTGPRANEQYNLEFDLIDDTGETRVQVVELPAARLNSLEIVPLTRKGAVAFGKVTLSNGAIRYSWDEQGQCSQHEVDSNAFGKQPCDAGSPSLAVVDESSVAISVVPKNFSARSLGARVCMALSAAFGLFLSGIWLLSSYSGASWAECLKSCGNKILWLVFAGIYLYQFSLIVKYAVDAPYLDEWIFFEPNALPQGLTWRWLFDFYVTHRIVPTKLIAWLNLKLFGLDFAKAIIFNYLLFGLLLAALMRLKQKIVGNDSFAFFSTFMLFLLSPIAYQNHMWGFTSQFHLVLLFSTLALYHAYDRNLTTRSTVVFCLFSVLAMYTFSAGAVFAIAYLLSRSVYIIANLTMSRIERHKGGTALCTSWVVVGGGLLFWFQGFQVQPTAWSQPLVFPSELKFWEYLLNVVSLGFGITTEGLLPGVVCLIVAIMPLVILAARKETRWLPSTWHVLTAILGIIAVLSAISMGRSDLIGNKIPRYAEIAFLLIPYGALAWWLALKDQTYRPYVLSALWLACCVSYLDDWSTGIYADFRRTGIETLMCSEHYYQGFEEGACADIPYSNLDQAKMLDVKFTRSFEVSKLLRKPIPRNVTP